MIKIKNLIANHHFWLNGFFPHCISFARSDGLLILIKSPVDPHSMNTNEENN